MHNSYTIPIWKKAPFIRLLIPLAAGILLQWHFQFPLPAILISVIGLTITYLLFSLFSMAARFKLQPIQGLILNLLLISFGLLATLHKDTRNSKDWYGNIYREGDLMLIKVDEPLIKKAKSFKSNGFVEAIIRQDSVIACNGKILLYFSKDGDKTNSAGPQLQYGDKILINKNLQKIKNSGNPGAFNYERYAAFQQIFHNVFLKEKDWIKTGEPAPNLFNRFIFNARDNILSILRKHINSGKDELGIAQALLIGYTNDLDRDLVQAYSNTGVVHIIAISGMHLALIYLLLVQVFGKIPLLNRSKLLQVLLILSCLWLFSLLTGASASVLRAAVMFSFITVGTNLKKRSSIYNSLAASAFVMLCYNPFFLWDVGFQLSYLAVVSIIVFQQTVYNCWHIKNKWIEKVWELAAVSLSAQVLTFPVCIYYFHQFPNFFLLTNIIAVPLSSVILYVEIGLVALSPIPVVAPFIGKIVTWLVWLMNQVVLWVNKIPFAVWEGIPSTVLSTCLLYGVTIGFSAWFIKKNRRMFGAALVCFLAFVMVSIYKNWQIKTQQKLIVYNISQHRAIDFINGNDFNFIGDSVLLQDLMLQNFNLKPARIALQVENRGAVLKNLFHNGSFYQFNNKKILLIDGPISFDTISQKTAVDIIIISKNPAIKITQLAKVFSCGQYIFDASNSLWKIDKWQKECEELHLRSYSVPERGAFVLDVRE
ncbi:MAG: ComEC/Rec2 family competence protein [Ferruginibacter sp.]